MDKFAGVDPLEVFTNNQLVVEVTPTAKLTAVPSVLVTATFCGVEIPEPKVAVKVAAFGLSTRRAELLTTRVTWIVCGVLVAPEGVTVIVPV